jgi:predicted TIM-barrel fold metal-dependent hydrolase
MTTDGQPRRYVVISADMHCGASIQGYKPYLEKRYHEEFDAWAATYRNPWGEIDNANDEVRIGVSSYDSPANWDSSKRIPHVEGQGIAGEVLFPNTTPPFYPSGIQTTAPPADPPKDRRDYELRFAGIRAHNRWVADFCRELPGRRIGLAQVFLSDLDDTLAEIRRAREDGLGGVLMPPDVMEQVQHLYYPRYDAVWSLCCELDMPVGQHGFVGSEGLSEESGPAGLTIGLLGAAAFAGRSITSLIMSGVFDRFPTLKWFETEAGVAFFSGHARQLDAFVDVSRVEGTIAWMISRETCDRLQKKPSEYLVSNCYFGTFLTDNDLQPGLVSPVSRIMWGADFPHHEGTWPWTVKALRRNFAGWAEPDVRQVLSGTAADCFGFDLSQLRAVADRIGPSVEEIAKPLAPEELPRYPSETICTTFVDIDPSMGMRKTREDPQTVLAGSESPA